MRETLSTRFWMTQRTTFRNKTVTSELKSDAGGLKSEHEEVLGIHFFNHNITFEHK